jgi:hypothetical protein
LAKAPWQVPTILHRTPVNSFCQIMPSQEVWIKCVAKWMLYL